MVDLIRCDGFLCAGYEPWSKRFAQNKTNAEVCREVWNQTSRMKLKLFSLHKVLRGRLSLDYYCFAVGST